MTCERLAILVHDLSLGGTERIAIRLANEWAADGRRVDVICGNSTGPLRRLVSDKLRLILPPSPIKRGLGSRDRLGRFAAAACSEHRIEGLFIPGNYHFSALPAFAEAAGPSRPAVIAQLSNSPQRTGRGKLLQALAQRRMVHRLQRADAVVAMSLALAQEAQECFGAMPLSVIPSPVLSSPSRAIRGSRARPLHLVAAGRFVAQKNLSLAVRTLAALDRQDARLSILGDGPYRPAVERLARDIGVSDRVEFAGHVDYIQSWLEQAGIFLLTSTYEGYPAVAIEALAAGIPVVSTDCSPAMHEILSHPSLGEVVASSAPGALAGAVMRVLHRPPAEDDLTASIVERHSIGTIGPRYLDLFDRPFNEKAKR